MNFLLLKRCVYMTVLLLLQVFSSAWLDAPSLPLVGMGYTIYLLFLPMVPWLLHLCAFVCIVIGASFHSGHVALPVVYWMGVGAALVRYRHVVSESFYLYMGLVMLIAYGFMLIHGFSWTIGNFLGILLLVPVMVKVLV